LSYVPENSENGRNGVELSFVLFPEIIISLSTSLADVEPASSPL
jgi:hypothetical protein